MKLPDRNSDPRRPTGTTPEAHYAQFTHGKLNPPRRQMPPRAPEIPRNSGTTQCYQIISESGDYVLAGTWDGTTLGPPVAIAKDFLLQTSLLSRTIYGTVVHYSYAGTDPIVRGASPVGAATIYEVISPAYALGDLIYPERVNFSGVLDDAGNPITLMDTKTSRVWATQAT